MIQYYSPDISLTGELPEGESHHCCRVLRMKEGDEIFISDGKGTRFRCIIKNAHPKHTKIEIIDSENFTSKSHLPNVVLCVAPTKNAERIEWMVEKAVELGVNEIILLKCERSERKVFNIARLEKIMISAMNQSLGTFLPKISEMIQLKEFLKKGHNHYQKFFGYCSEEFPKKEFVKEYIPGSDVMIMIGPEGDFTRDEVNQAIEAGFKPVTFGEKRLRTETACLYAVCAVLTLNRLNS